MGLVDKIVFIVLPDDLPSGEPLEVPPHQRVGPSLHCWWRSAARRWIPTPLEGAQLECLHAQVYLKIGKFFLQLENFSRYNHSFASLPAP
jgi:hypothetical protein